MFKVIVTLDYWPVENEEKEILAVLAEVICDNAEQAHQVGEQLCGVFEYKSIVPAYITTHYDIV
jgi:hypothetical protein